MNGRKTGIGVLWIKCFFLQLLALSSVLYAIIKQSYFKTHCKRTTHLVVGLKYVLGAYTVYSMRVSRYYTTSCILGAFFKTILTSMKITL